MCIGLTAQFAKMMKETVYFGETARTGYERMREHQDLIRNSSLESPIVEHFEEAHPDVEVSVEMKMVAKEARPLDRKTLEGTLIAEYRKGELMNRKGEWGQNLPPQFGPLGEENPAEKRLRKERKRPRKDEVSGLEVEVSVSESVESPRKRVRIMAAASPTPTVRPTGSDGSQTQARPKAQYGSILGYLAKQRKTEPRCSPATDFSGEINVPPSGIQQNPDRAINSSEAQLEDDERGDRAGCLDENESEALPPRDTKGESGPGKGGSGSI